MFANVQYILVEEWDAILQPCVAGLVISMTRKCICVYVFFPPAIEDHYLFNKRNMKLPICILGSLLLISCAVHPTSASSLQIGHC